MARLGVNIDHVATVRQARRASEPDPVWAATLAELGGADGITVHLREDRRHIQDRDVRLLRETISVPLNLEMACVPEIVEFARGIRPDQITLVPEKREEVTTEGGLDIVARRAAVDRVVARLKEENDEVVISLFLDPDTRQIEAAAGLGADAVELHTGSYALAAARMRRDELRKLVAAGKQVRDQAMTLNAGHGLNYQNVTPVARIVDMRELNIGHGIISRAVYVGLERAVREMKALIH